MLNNDVTVGEIVSFCAVIVSFMDPRADGDFANTS